MSSRTRRIPHLLLAGVLALGIPCAHAADAPPRQDPPFKHYIGYHGPDGTQVYPNSKPPTKWDGAKGENILWKTALPFVGYGSPIVVGGKVFLMSEPGYKSDFPELVCLDAAGGKILWQRAINHLEVAIPDAAERAKVAKDWHDSVVRNQTVLALDFPKVASISGHQNRTSVCPKIQKEKEKAVAAVTIPVGREYPAYSLQLDLAQHGGGNRRGDTFPTPCSDGKSIFVMTAWRQFACFDLEGKQRWLRWIPEATADDYHVAGASRSPVAWNGLFIADLHGFIRAFDAGTGATRWEINRAALGLKTVRGLSPKIFRVGDQDLLWCAGPVVVRLSDGKPLKLEGWTNSGAMVAVNTDSPDTLFFAGGGQFGEWSEKGVGKDPAPAAVKFALAGEVLRGTVLWSGLEGVPSASDQAVIAYDQGKVFFFNWCSYLDKHSVGVILDASNGKVLAGKINGEHGVPPVCQAFAITGSNLFGIGSGGPFGCEPVSDGKKVTVSMYVLDKTGPGKTRPRPNMLTGPEPSPEHDAMLMLTGRLWQFSPWLPFSLGGDRIYVRGSFELTCIGLKTGGN